MIRPILRYGERGLHERAADVTSFDDSLHRLIDDMVETMYAAPGIGLAATQVGVPLRVFVIDLQDQPVSCRRGEQFRHVLARPWPLAHRREGVAMQPGRPIELERAEAMKHEAVHSTVRRVPSGEVTLTPRR